MVYDENEDAHYIWRQAKQIFIQPRMRDYLKVLPPGVRLEDLTIDQFKALELRLPIPLRMKTGLLWKDAVPQVEKWVEDQEMILAMQKKPTKETPEKDVQVVEWIAWGLYPSVESWDQYHRKRGKR